MRGYRELFRVPEFTPFFTTVSLQVAAGTIAGPAVATIVFSATGSPLLSALSMFGPSLAQIAGALTLLSIADRVPPRRAMVWLAVVTGATQLIPAVPGMPVWAIMAITLASGLAGSVGGGVRYGLLNEILPADGYVLGRSVLNMSVGVMQIAGFSAGGALIAVMSPPSALTVSASLQLVAAVVARCGLSARRPRSAGRPSARETLRVDRMLWSSRSRRDVYLALWVPNGLVVGCEALFIPYSAAAPGSAGLLFVSGALGMLAGDAAVGRFTGPGLRARLVNPLRVLLAVPYLAFAVSPPPPVAAALVAVASFGFGAGLILQERLLAATPAEAHGQALGLHGSGLPALQAVGATAAGALAGVLPAGSAMAAMGAVSLCVTLILSRRLNVTAEGDPPAREGAPSGGGRSAVTVACDSPTDGTG